MTCCLTHRWTDEDGATRCSNKLEVSCSQAYVDHVFSVGRIRMRGDAEGESNRDVCVTTRRS